MSEQELLLALKALSDSTRFKILTLLRDHDFCVRAMARNLGISEAAVSQHLQVLKAAGLVVGEKRGYYVHHQVQPAALLQVISELQGLAEVGERCERSDCRSGAGRCAGACHPNGTADTKPYRGSE
jgi:ArsR family transcriptional regulator